MRRGLAPRQRLLPTRRSPASRLGQGYMDEGTTSQQSEEEGRGPCRHDKARWVGGTKILFQPFVADSLGPSLGKASSVRIEECPKFLEEEIRCTPRFLRCAGCAGPLTEPPAALLARYKLR